MIWVTVSNEDLVAVSASEFKAQMDGYINEGSLVGSSHPAYKMIRNVVERLLVANQYKKVQKINSVKVTCGE